MFFINKEWKYKKLSKKYDEEIKHVMNLKSLLKIV